jgi:hypothetical protein
MFPVVKALEESGIIYSFLGSGAAEIVGVVKAFEEEGWIIHFVDAKLEGIDVVGIDAEADFLAGQIGFAGGERKKSVWTLATGRRDECEKAGKKKDWFPAH